MSGHGHIDTENKNIALLIAVLALFLAIAETMAKGAQTEALSRNVEASNLWAFYQAKTVRQTTVRSLAELLEVEARGLPPERAEDAAKRITAWRATADRYESEPGEGGGEGRRELVQRAKVAEGKRDLYLAKYHQYEVSSAAFQIAIVLASATVITGAMWLAWTSGLLGLVGLAFAGIGLLAPNAVHLF